MDPSQILEISRTLESGSLEEKLDLIERLDVMQPLGTGIMMRALADQDTLVRKAALARLADANVKPLDVVLQQLLRDPDPEIRELAEDLSQREDATNPLERLIPMVEGMTDQLGPFGDMLKGMIGSLRDVGEGDEKSQLMAVMRLTRENPASPVVVQQALRSEFISVRLAALRKVTELPTVNVPEDLLTEFLSDPSQDIRQAAEKVAGAGRVGGFDTDAYRAETLKSMKGSLLSGLGDKMPDLGKAVEAMGGLDGLKEKLAGVDLDGLQEKLADVDQDALSEAAEEVGSMDPDALKGMLNGFDPSMLQGMLGGLDPAMLQGLMQNLNPAALQGMLKNLNPASIMQMAQQFQGMGMGAGQLKDMAGRLQGTADELRQTAQRVREMAAEPHRIDGWIYLVGDARVRDRMLRSLARKAGGVEPAYTRVLHQDNAERWAIRPTDTPPSRAPSWPNDLAITLTPAQLGGAEQARNLSEHVWGAAWADHASEISISLAFHDGILSRAEWGGAEPGSWSGSTGSGVGSTEGPLALLTAFLADPTDDELENLPEPITLRQAKSSL